MIILVKIRKGQEDTELEKYIGKRVSFYRDGREAITGMFVGFNKCKWTDCYTNCKGYVVLHDVSFVDYDIIRSEAVLDGTERTLLASDVDVQDRRSAKRVSEPLCLSFNNGDERIWKVASMNEDPAIVLMKQFIKESNQKEAFQQDDGHPKVKLQEGDIVKITKVKSDKSDDFYWDFIHNCAGNIGKIIFVGENSASVGCLKCISYSQVIPVKYLEKGWSKNGR